ncbi:MAG: hypothetical protein R3D44_08485 [Hyphomicrobiaceae bacterium]
MDADRLPGFKGGAAAAMVGVALLGPCAATAAPEVASTLSGSWGGSGRIYYTDNSSENISCSAYYTSSGNDLRMAIQCRSDRNPIHIRSTLRIDGRRASGEWEERTFNASGRATGTVSPGNISLQVSGGGFNGSMTVSYSKSSHTVTISTQGIAMKSATMRFSRR